MIENDVVVEGGDEFDENPDLLKTLEPDSEMKEWLINYVGKKEQPENGEVNIEMILTVMAEEFPEFLLPLAEENFVRGYQQALLDVEEGRLAWKEEMTDRQEQSG